MNVDQILINHTRCMDELSRKDLDDLIQASHELKIAAGEPVLETGHAVDHACIVLEGKVASVFTRDWKEQGVLQQIGVGEILCEAELLSEDNCQSDIKALEDSRILCIPRQRFIELAGGHPALLQYLTEQAHSRTSHLLITQYINSLFGTSKLQISNPLLRLKAEEEWLNFEHEVLAQLKQNAQWKVLKRGEYLFHQGDEPDGAYILASGVLGVTIRQEDGEREIARVHHGEIVGELALVNDARRSANIVALRECELFRLSPTEFNHIAEKYPRVILNVYRAISDRFRERTSGYDYRPKQSNIAIITLTQDNTLAMFADEIFNSLSQLDTAEYLTSDAVDNLLGRAGIANIGRNEPGSIGLMQWLNGRESRSRFIVYRADDEWSNWTMRCISQADRVIVLTDLNEMPDFTDFKNHLSAAGQNWSLVLLHPEATDRPRNTAAWRTASGASDIFHVRRKNDDDLARLVRILAGRAIGLVFGGGGARGFAHLGVLRAFEELGIKIDMVGGTSIGAPIAGMAAQGKSASECLDLSIKAFSSLIDMTIPFTSMISGKRISRTIADHTADWDIEDYWLPYFCVSTNLTTAKQVVHRCGNSALAIRSSVSIPGVLPPVPANGDLLVDGGVLNNVPINIMREINPSGSVIAFDVAPPMGPTAKQDYGTSVSGWYQLASRFVPWLKPVRAPRVGVVLMQAMMVGSNLLREQVLQKKMADYYQNIHVRKVGMLDFKAIKQAERVGYESVIEPLRQWLEKSNGLD
jgi:predicted acylesterase/phospholipase RssA/CRP-like cAMP-binding protein